jgi:hypothetical protein
MVAYLSGQGGAPANQGGKGARKAFAKREKRGGSGKDTILTKRTRLSLDRKGLSIFDVLKRTHFECKKTPNELKKHAKNPPFARHLTGIRELAECRKG